MGAAATTDGLADECLEKLRASPALESQAARLDRAEAALSFERIGELVEQEFLSERQKERHYRAMLDLIEESNSEREAAFRTLMASEVVSAKNKAVLLTAYGSLAPGEDVGFEEQLAGSLVHFYRAIGCDACIKNLSSRVLAASSNGGVTSSTVAGLLRLGLIDFNAGTREALLKGCENAEAAAVDAVAVTAWDQSRSEAKQDESVQVLAEAGSSLGGADSAYLAYLIEDASNSREDEHPARDRKMNLLQVAVLGASVQARATLARRIAANEASSIQSKTASRFLAGYALDRGDGLSGLTLRSRYLRDEEVLSHWSAELNGVLFSAIQGDEFTKSYIAQTIAKGLEAGSEQ